MRLLILLAIVGLILLLRRPLLEKLKSLSNKERIKYGLYAAAAIIILLAMTGRVHWLSAIVAAIIPFVRAIIPWLIRFAPWIAQQAQSHARQHKNSHVQTHTLYMELDHESGSMHGEVLKGPFAGQVLESLSLDQTLQLLNWVTQHDQEAIPLVETYLSHHYPNTQWQDAYHKKFNSSYQSANSQSSSAMTRAEALAILGLQDPIEKSDVIKAHRKLMSKYHPDKGGNDYLASKINQAKDLLI